MKLKDAIRKMELYEKTGARPGELCTDIVAVPVGNMGNVIGKQGSVVKKLEETYKVVLNIQSSIGEVKIEGTKEGVRACKAAIQAIANTMEKTFSLENRGSLSRVLMMAKARRLRQIEDDARVVLRIEKSSG